MRKKIPKFFNNHKNINKYVMINRLENSFRVLADFFPEKLYKVSSKIVKLLNDYNEVENNNTLTLFKWFIY